MATQDYNPGGVPAVYGTTLLPIFRDTPTRGLTTTSLADTVAYSLGSPGDQAAGHYMVWESDVPEDFAIFAVTTASNVVTGVTLVVAGVSSNWIADGTTNDKFGFYVTAGELFLENNFTAASTLCIARLGAA